MNKKTLKLITTITAFVMGIAVLFLSQIFTYGENLEKEVEGLIWWEKSYFI